MNKKILLIMTGILIALFSLVGIGEESWGQILSFDIEQRTTISYMAKLGIFCEEDRAKQLNVKRQDLTPGRARLLLVDVESSYGDPLAGLTITEEPYDIILIIPKGIDDGSVVQIWLVTRFFEEASLEDVGLTALSGIIDQIFQGLATTIDVSEDLWPAGYATLYLQQGWLR
jgi:hypothetical protein